MKFSALTAISPVDGRYSELSVDLAPYFSEFALLRYRLQIELAWLLELSNLGIIKPAITPKDRGFLAKIAAKFDLIEAERLKTIELETKHDVKALEYYIKEKLHESKGLGKILEFVHFGSTSDDTNSLAYGLMIKDALAEALFPKMEKLVKELKNWAHLYAATPMIARTHGQYAVGTTLGKEFANFAWRLETQLKAIRKTPIMGKFNGTVGNFNALVVAYPEYDWPKSSEKFVRSLGLSYSPYTTQIEPHDRLAELGLAISHFNHILLGFNRDLWGYISLGYFSQKAKSKEVGSSVMPHKVNPINFENAEGNLGIANSLLLHFAEKLPVSRWQRDLSDSTVLRNLGVAFAHSLIAYQNTLEGLNRISLNEKLLREELNQHWEILAEAVQTVMRSVGIKDSYQKVKEFSRGQKVDRAKLQAFIKSLKLPTALEKKLLALTPENYLGFAKELAKKV
jgi:adenylosuccinate lyase